MFNLYTTNYSNKTTYFVDISDNSDNESLILSPEHVHRLKKHKVQDIYHYNENKRTVVPNAVVETKRVPDEKAAVKAKRVPDEKAAVKAKRVADAKAAVEAKRIADAKLAVEAKRVADEKAAVEAKRVADEKADLKAKRIADEKAAVEAKRIADEKAAVEAKRVADAKADAETQRTKDKQIADENAAVEAKRVADAKAAVEAKRIADEKAAVEAKRVADAKAAVEAKRIADEKAAEAKRITEAKRVADEKAATEAKRIADEKAAAEAKRVADEKAAAETKQKADEKATAEAKRVADAKSAAEAKRVADANSAAEAKRIADAKLAAEAKRVADEKAAVEAKRVADAKADVEAKRIADEKAAVKANATNNKCSACTYTNQTDAKECKLCASPLIKTPALAPNKQTEKKEFITARNIFFDLFSLDYDNNKNIKIFTDLSQNSKYTDFFKSNNINGLIDTHYNDLQKKAADGIQKKEEKKEYKLHPDVEAKYTRKPQLDDGNCFFYTLKYLLKLSETVQEIRQNIVKYIKENSEELMKLQWFHPQIISILSDTKYKDTMTIDNYVTYMSEDKIFAGQIEIYIASRIYQCRILVINQDGLPSTNNESSRYIFTSKPPVYMHYCSSVKGGIGSHFEALELKTPQPEEKKEFLYTTLKNDKINYATYETTFFNKFKPNLHDIKKETRLNIMFVASDGAQPEIYLIEKLLEDGYTVQNVFLIDTKYQTNENMLDSKLLNIKKELKNMYNIDVYFYSNKNYINELSSQIEINNIQNIHFIININQNNIQEYNIEKLNKINMLPSNIIQYNINGSNITETKIDLPQQNRKGGYVSELNESLQKQTMRINKMNNDIIKKKYLKYKKKYINLKYMNLYP